MLHLSIYLPAPVSGGLGLPDCRGGERRLELRPQSLGRGKGSGIRWQNGRRRIQVGGWGRDSLRGRGSLLPLPFLYPRDSGAGTSPARTGLFLHLHRLRSRDVYWRWDGFWRRSKDGFRSPTGTGSMLPRLLLLGRSSVL